MSVAKAKGTFIPSRYEGGGNQEAVDFINQESGYPDPPDYIQGNARRQVIAILRLARDKGDWIAWSDLPSLWVYASFLQDFERLADCPEIDIDEKGNKRMSAEFRAKKEAALMIDRLSQRFGLDPSAKGAFDFSKKEQKEEDFTDWNL